METKNLCYFIEWWGETALGGWLRGQLNKDEYDAYISCERWFGWRDAKYLPTGDQIIWMAEHTDASCETLWSMYNKLNEEAQS